jgi:dUTP pyrophosphatase
MLYTSTFGYEMVYAKELDIGMDLPCVINKNVIDNTRRFDIDGTRRLGELLNRRLLNDECNEVWLPPMSWSTLPTGINVKVPDDSWLMITARSSTFFNKGLLVVQGVIDAGYTGELMTRIFNLNQKTIAVSDGEKLAQAIIVPRYRDLKIRLADELPKTERGDTGFGSSGRGGGCATHRDLHENQ